MKNNMNNLDYLEEYDKLKTKVLKYIMYKKRTEKEIRQKFYSSIDEEILDDIIEELKELNYIDDFNYIERAVKEYIKLKNMSIKELRYKLISKGLESNLIEDYISKNIDILNDYEIQSIKNILIKKQSVMEQEEVINFLLKKGYTMDNIKDVIKG